MLDLVFMHADLGFPAYRPIAEKMVSSFRSVADCRVIQIADMHSEPIAGVEVISRNEINAQNIMMKRPEVARGIVAARAHHDVVLCDADIVWQKDPHDLFQDEFDIGLMWRSQALSMPYICCLMLIRQQSESAREFLTDWWMTTMSMPKELQSLWGDQFALASMVGRQYPNTIVQQRGVRIKIFDAGDIVGTMHGKDHKVSERVYCKHYKGGTAKDLKFAPWKIADVKPEAA